MTSPVARVMTAICLLATMSGRAAVPAGAAPARVLFIGNSLTYENNLPAMVEALAAQAGLQGALICRGVARPNFGLEEHWSDGEALRGLQSGRWTHVVLQQGPTSLPDSRAVLRSYTKKFAFEIKARGAKTVLYGVWPPRARLAFQDAVTESYRLAAEDVGGAVVPVGEGWRAAWRRDPSLPLYGPDDFHPSPLGSYLAALMFFEHLTGRTPVGLPSPSTSKDRALAGVRVEPAALAALQEAAAEATAHAREEPAR